MSKKVLLVNPWIEDFSAFDQWIKPIPLLKIVRWLKERGVGVEFVDCLDRSIWGGKTKRWNSGKFRATIIEKPAPLNEIPRHFKIFGGTPEECRKILEELEPPDFVLTGIPITYWYPGLAKLTGIVKEIFPETKIILGGNYATLLPRHAKEKCKADMILSSGSYEELQGKLASLLDIENRGDLFHTLPDLSFYPVTNKTSAILTGQGCPFKCTYCAVPILFKKFRRRNLANVLDELIYLADTGVEDVAFFDDALLVDSERFIKKLLKEIIKIGLPIRFHLPNAVHLRFIDDEIAHLMKEANFKTIRLGLENIDPYYTEKTGGKAEIKHIIRGIEALKKAGFKSQEVGAYVMFGAPGEKIESIMTTIEFLNDYGIKAILVTYSPVPGTPDFFNFIHQFPDVAKEPLLHNKVVVMYRIPEYFYVKKFADSLNSRLI